MKNLICAVTVLAVGTAHADTIYVDANGGCHEHDRRRHGPLSRRSVQS